MNRVQGKDPAVNSAWQAAALAGHDMDMLEESIELSPEERLRLHELGMERVRLLEAAMTQARADGRETA
ncbi:MAG TPA: hypothetical protein VF720_16465 [Candidatus Eisenbacteria bacterium]